MQVEAEVVALQPGRVLLRTSDGEVFDVPDSSLSQADQDYLRGLRQAKEAEKPAETSNPAGSVPYGPPRKLAKLANSAIDESSGLACSRRHPGLFWTHNDSGDEARVYLTDARGRDLGSCLLTGVIAYDWEDIVSFERAGKSYLLLCDVGNNGRAAAVQMLHLVEEPPADPKRGVTLEKVPVVQTIFYSYEDDHRDCEAVAVDPTSDTLLFVTRELALKCLVYALPWPKVDAEKAWVARRIASLELLPVTAMDVSPDGRRAIVLTYANAYEYVRQQDEDWAAAFARPPRQIIMPLRIQGVLNMK